MADEYRCKLVLEGFADNPFLAKFYENPKRYAFPVELFFMTERHKQMQDAFSNFGLFEDFILSDYCFPKTLLFAQNNLTTDEYRLFHRIYRVLFSQFPNPSLLVYLHRPVDALLEQIQKRGRSYESNIDADYLQSIQDAYFGYFKGITQFPVVIVDVKDMDYVKSEKDYHQLLELISGHYLPGLHRISLI
jgi:deoxyadenosine/deoxycytidine kinase